jgi:DNA-binding transcriptional MerR regulator
MNISVKALRNYDAIDLLKPFYVDESSRYRYYSYEQFFYIDLIRYLNKSLYVPLEDIKLMLNEKRDLSDLLLFLEKHKKSVEDKIKEYEYSRNILAKVIQDIKKHSQSNLSNTIFEQYLLRREIYVKDANVSIYDIDSYFKRNEKVFHSTQAAEGNNMCYVYHKDDYDPSSNDLLISKMGIISDRKIAGLNKMVLPEGRYVCCKFRYSEEESIRVIAAIVRYAESKNIQLSKIAIQTFNIVDLAATSKYEYEMEFQVLRETP